MKRDELIRQICRKRSMLCVGLDPDPQKIPVKYRDAADPVLAFLKQVVRETADYAVAFKPNLAFFEADGPDGMTRFQELVGFIREHYPEIFLIADAKRGDIGNTAARYAKTFFTTYDCDAVTLSPYMGSDSIRPFLEFRNKWSVVLGLTSNPGASDIELMELKSGERVFEHSMHQVAKLGGSDQIMFVVGATKPEQLKILRKQFPDHFFLVPGVGAQGGSVEEVCSLAATTFGGLLINSSRGILYPENESAEPHRLAAWELQFAMANSIECADQSSSVPSS